MSKTYKNSGITKNSLLNSSQQSTMTMNVSVQQKKSCKPGHIALQTIEMPALDIFGAKPTRRSMDYKELGGDLFDSTSLKLP